MVLSEAICFWQLQGYGFRKLDGESEFVLAHTSG